MTVDGPSKGPWCCAHERVIQPISRPMLTAMFGVRAVSAMVPFLPESPRAIVCCSQRGSEFGRNPAITIVRQQERPGGPFVRAARCAGRSPSRRTMSSSGSCLAEAFRDAAQRLSTPPRCVCRRLRARRRRTKRDARASSLRTTDRNRSASSVGSAGSPIRHLVRAFRKPPAAGCRRQR